MEGPGFEYLVLCVFMSQCQKLGSLWHTGIFELQESYRPKRFVDIFASPFCLCSFNGLEYTVSKTDKKTYQVTEDKLSKVEKAAFISCHRLAEI